MTLNKPLLLVFIGNIGSGKSTVAKYIAQRIRAPYYSSDELRKFLGGWKPGQGKILFDYMFVQAFLEARVGAQVVVLDTTGQSPSFRYELNRARLEGFWNVYVVRLVCDAETWDKREDARTDREEGPLSINVYYSSLDAASAISVDVEWDTSGCTPGYLQEGVYNDLQGPSSPIRVYLDTPVSSTASQVN